MQSETRSPQMAEEIQEQLIKHLTDAHSIEEQALTQLRRAPGIAGDAELASVFETHSHEERVRARLDARGSSPSRVKDIGMRLGGFAVGGFFGAQRDTPAKLMGFAFAFEHLEIAGYEQLKRVAERAGDPDTVQLAETIAAEERAMAARIAA